MGIQSRSFPFIQILLLVIGSAAFFSVPVIAWDEDTFYGKTIIVARPFVLPEKLGDPRAQTIIGSPRQYILQKKDTFLDIARYFDLGYNEVSGVYPNMDPWLPPAG